MRVERFRERKRREVDSRRESLVEELLRKSKRKQERHLQGAAQDDLRQDSDNGRARH